jgi:hypothetical protein
VPGHRCTTIIDPRSAIVAGAVRTWVDAVSHVV